MPVLWNVSVLSLNGARYSAWLANRLHLDQQFGVAQRHIEEELQAAERGIDGRRRCAGLDHVQLEGPKILGSGRVRRSLEIGGEPANGADVVDLGLAVELAHPHVVDHALAQRGDGGRQ